MQALWDLFCKTGNPLFYTLYARLRAQKKRERAQQEETGKTA